MGGRRFGAVLGAAVAVLLLAGCASGTAEKALPVPTFAGAAGGATSSAPPRIGLPSDCGDLLSADDLGAIYGRALGSTQVSTIIGVPEPSVGRTQRTGCTYSSNEGGGGALLSLNVGRYTDAAAAQALWKANTDAERTDGRARDLNIGTAKAVAVERPTETLLAVVYGVDTLSFVLPASARLPGAPVDRLVDLALRVLPRDAPTQPTPPDAAPASVAPTTPPPTPATIAPVASG